MRTASQRLKPLTQLRTVRLITLVGAASLLVLTTSCEEEVGDLVPCVTDAECGVVCAAQCGSSGVASASCDDSRCSCECDMSGTGGSGGGIGGGGGMGGGSGGGGMGGGGMGGGGFGGGGVGGGGFGGGAT